jgi:hypothetical protein
MSYTCTTNKLYIFGGVEGTDYKNDLLEFDMEEKIWKQLEISNDIPDKRVTGGFCS